MSGVLVSIVLAASVNYQATLVSCYDADTCRFNIHLGLDVTLVNQSVRLCDIDAPEMRGDSRPAGIIAQTWLLDRLQAASRVYLEVPRNSRGTYKRGKYGRWMGWLWGCDREGHCVSLNAAIVQAGHAVPYSEKCTR